MREKDEEKRNFELTILKKIKEEEQEDKKIKNQLKMKVFEEKRKRDIMLQDA